MKKNNNDINHCYDESTSIKNINVYEIKCIKTIREKFAYIYFLLLLQDKRVASCSSEKTIRIFNPSNDYHCDQVIKRHREGITSICELEDGTIVSCSYDKSIIIDDYTIKNAHESYIRKVITLPNNRIASCSWDHTIKIWKSDPPYSDTPIKVLKGHSSYVNSILYIKERDILISASYDKTLRLWNMSTYQCVTVIQEEFSYDLLYSIDNNQIILNGYDILNIDKCMIEKGPIRKTAQHVSCIKLRDNKTFLGGCSKGKFCFFNINRRQYKFKKKIIIVIYMIS